MMKPPGKEHADGLITAAERAPGQGWLDPVYGEHRCMVTPLCHYYGEIVARMGGQ